VSVLSIARSSPVSGSLLISAGVPVTIEDLVDAAAISRKDVISGLRAFEEQRMIHIENDVYVISHWSERQYESDGSNERVKRFRERKRNADVTLQETDSNVSETPPDNRVQITDTELREREINAREEIDTEPKTDIEKAVMTITAFHIEQKLKPAFTPNVADRLRAMGTEYPLAWIQEAIEETKLRGIRSLNYLDTMLADWQANGKSPKERRREEKTHGISRTSTPPDDDWAQAEANFFRRS
jgi:DNA replication protein DnaD